MMDTIVTFLLFPYFPGTRRATDAAIPQVLFLRWETDVNIKCPYVLAASMQCANATGSEHGPGNEKSTPGAHLGNESVRM